MKSLRLPIDSLTEGLQALSPEAATYATRVHRLGPGGRLLVFDPERAEEADAEITTVEGRAVMIRVGAVRRASQRPDRAVTLLQGVGKGDKLDAIVRDATELGATAIVPVLCERSVARPDAARAVRWRRIAVEAARQCGRGDVPAIATPLPFPDAMRLPLGDALRICLDPAAERPLGDVLAGLGPRGVVLAVGPEGGLTAAEVAVAESAGFVRVTLGPLVLRTETVCAAVLGALLALLPGFIPPPPGD